jgi:hypothetical protein
MIVKRKYKSEKQSENEVKKKSQTASRSLFLHSKSAFESKLPTLPEISVEG